MDASSASTVSEIAVATADSRLIGDLTLPARCVGVVAFAHGSGSSRHSPRNRRVAEHLNQASLGTLLLDLLTAEEERLDMRTGELRFDIALLARRLGAALDLLGEQRATAHLGVGCFGASTGAAAALVAAAERGDRVRAVVSRGGRPDLAGEGLALVTAPTLLIVGGADPVVLDLNRQAQAAMRCETRLEIIPGATHLFEEPGALERVADLASDWFLSNIAPSRRLPQRR